MINKHSIDFEKPVGAILVDIELNAEVAEKLQLALIGKNRNAMIALLKDLSSEMTITSVFKDKKGMPIYMYNSLSVIHLLEYLQAEEGVIRLVTLTEEMPDGSSTLSGVKLQACIPFSELGAIQFNNDEVLTVTFDFVGDTVTSIETTSLELPVAAPNYLKIDKLSVEQGKSEKSFDVKGAQTIMIPLDSITPDTLLLLKYSNGQICTYGRTQLEMIGLTANDATIEVDGTPILSGFALHAILDASTLNSIEVKRSSSTVNPFDIVTVRTELMEDLLVVAQINNSLKDTTVQATEESAQRILSNQLY